MSGLVTTAFLRDDADGRSETFGDLDRSIARLGLRVHLLPETVTYHRQHDMNRSLRNGDRSRDEFLHLIKAKLDRNRGGAVGLSAKKAEGS
ncbi:MAG: hypothetical protein ABI399_00840 [Bauldia sp.]